MKDIKDYLEQTNTVLLTKDAFEWLKERAGVIEAEEEKEPCEDAISRQAAIDVVHEYFEKYLKLNDDICLDGIRSLPSVAPKQEPRWIPVSERLPENIDSVLVWFEYSYDDSWCEGYGLAYYADGWGWRLDSNADYPTVKAWMPLPEPYKGGE